MKKYKIAIILFGFYESGLSLAKALTEQGLSVDVYSFSSRLNSECAGFGFEYKTKRHYRLPGRIYEIDYKNSKGVSFASKRGQSHIYVMQGTLTGVSRTGLPKRILEKISVFFLNKMTKVINYRNYDIVDIVSQDLFSRHLYPIIKVPQIHSFHEVSDVEKRNNKDICPLIDLSIKRGDNIRLFSTQSAEIMEKIIREKYKKLHIVPFGLFYNYMDFGEIKMSELGELQDYVLYVGLIATYKGLPVLYEAMQEFWKKNPNVKCVIAGKGDDPVLEKMKNDSRFVVINRLLSNDEIIYIIKKSRFLVCPYLKASQSGLPQTAFVFGKPIIATKVGNFPDVISEGETGMLVPPNNIMELYWAIDKMYNDKKLYDKIINNIMNYESLNDKLSWKMIAQQYIQMIKKIL